MGAMLCPAYSGYSWTTGASQEHHLGRSGLPRYTSVPSTSRLHCSPAIHGRQFPVSSEKPHFRAYATAWDAHAFGLRLPQGCEMQCSAMDMPMPTCRQGTFPRGFIAKYSLLCCCCFRRATDLSSIGRDAHLKNCTDTLSAWCTASEHSKTSACVAMLVGNPGKRMHLMKSTTALEGWDTKSKYMVSVDAPI